MAQIEVEKIDAADPVPSTGEDKHHVSPARRVALLAILLVVVLAILIVGMALTHLSGSQVADRNCPIGCAVGYG